MIIMKKTENIKRLEEIFDIAFVKHEESDDINAMFGSHKEKCENIRDDDNTSCTANTSKITREKLIEVFGDIFGESECEEKINTIFDNQQENGENINDFNNKLNNDAEINSDHSTKIENNQNSMNKVKLLRGRLGITQTNLAKQIGISRPFLAAIENNINLLTLNVAEKLSKVFNCSIYELFEENSFVKYPDKDEDKLYLIKLLASNLKDSEVKDYIMALYNKDDYYDVNSVSAKIFGENLKRIRKSRQLKVYELANLAGIHKVWLGVLENGVKEPRPETIWKLAKALNCSVEELVNENHN